MSLDEYRRKRNFSVTPEPGPQLAPPAPQLRFFIQRHNASHLHYDFRLEMAGVLRSWAVPKGPTLSPLIKRLAMLVEDHPLAYGDFEGTIPAGNYGAGSVMLWDRGTYQPIGTATAEQQFARGDLKFTLHGSKLQGEFAIVRMSGKKANEWLLIKKKDQFAAADAKWDANDHAFSVLSGRTQDDIAEGRQATHDPMPKRIVPMAAMIAGHPPPSADEDWVYELKWDGVRAICFLEKGGEVHLQSRTGRAMAAQYPEITTALPAAVKAETAILDGELVALDGEGKSSFAALQPRIMAVNAKAVAKARQTTPVVLYLFDLLYVNGEDLRAQPLTERQERLRQLVAPDETIRLSPAYPGRGQELLQFAREHGLEGVLAKRATSTYESKRSPEWLKLKTSSQQEFVIVGYTVGNRSEFGALLIGIYQEKRLVYVSKVGTGFTGELLAQMAKRLEAITVAKSPITPAPKLPDKIHWVKPELVAEVRYSIWTKDGSLRAPVFLGLRDDVRPEDCQREDVPLETEPVAPKQTELGAGTADTARVTVDGHALTLTHLKKVWYPADGYTKRDVLAYYDAMAPALLPYLHDRALSLKRYPNGIHEDFFFQKNVDERFPDWLRREPLGDEGKQLPFCEDKAALLYLVNLGCIDQNPWMSRASSPGKPDYLLIDFDPVECAYTKVVEAAQWMRRTLEQIGLAGYPKTTGGDGLHIYVPIEPVYSFDQVKTFAEVLARWAAGEKPDLFTLPRAVAQRTKDRVYFDYIQIGEGKTIAAPYVLRAYDKAPVAMPLDWKEVNARLTPTQFNIKNARARFEKKGDLFAPVLHGKQRLEPALAALQQHLASEKTTKTKKRDGA